MRDALAILFQRNCGKLFSENIFGNYFYFIFLKKNIFSQRVVHKILHTRTKHHQNIFLLKNFFLLGPSACGDVVLCVCAEFCGQAITNCEFQKNKIAIIFMIAILFSVASAFCGERVQNSNTNAYVSGAVHRTRRERSNKYTPYERKWP